MKRKDIILNKDDLNDNKIKLFQKLPKDERERGYLRFMHYQNILKKPNSLCGHVAILNDCFLLLKYRAGFLVCKSCSVKFDTKLLVPWYEYLDIAKGIEIPDELITLDNSYEPVPFMTCYRCYQALSIDKFMQINNSGKININNYCNTCSKRQFRSYNARNIGKHKTIKYRFSKKRTNLNIDEIIKKVEKSIYGDKNKKVKKNNYVNPEINTPSNEEEIYILNQNKIVEANNNNGINNIQNHNIKKLLDSSTIKNNNSSNSEENINIIESKSNKFQPINEVASLNKEKLMTYLKDTITINNFTYYPSLAYLPENILESIDFDA